ncbi:hypothetical protein [Microbacterium sp.]|uniref:hypothetical protein n=1 Tax=Microbacterium sp. TaxID=51671 RepID=UPI0039E2F668
MGVSPRRLRGWEPRTTQIIHRDRWGRVERIVTVREPEYSENDMLLILASRREDQRPMSRTGLPLDVATDPRNDGQFEHIPTTDLALKDSNKVQKDFRDRYGDVVDVDALIWETRLRDDAPPAT